MSRGRVQSASVLAVLLAVLLVLAVSAVVAPGIGTGAEGAGLETPAPLGTPTVTESELEEGDDNTTSPVPEDPSADTSASVEDAHNNTTSGDLAAQRTALRGVQNLVNTTDPGKDGQSANLTSAVRLVRMGMKLQVAQGRQNDKPTDTANVALPATAAPTHDSPSAAAFAILNRYDVTPTPDQAANIRALDNLPEVTRSELTDLLDAYLGYAIATQTAYADANRTRLPTLADYAGVRASGNDTVAISKNETFLGSTDPDAQSAENTSRSTAWAGGLQTAGVDVARVRSAQIRLLEATVDLNTALEQADAPGLTTPASLPVNPYGVQVDPVLSVNLSMYNNTYEEDYRLQIDRGGNDTYNNSAGGAAIGPAALVDLGGMDSYNGRNGGGSCNSVGFLLDAGGSDTYDARSGGTNGGGSCGIGFLLDVSGDDVYTAGKEGTNGGGYFLGVGFLLDRSGSDTYNATDTATNGGGVTGGVGGLIDISGDDTYTAGSGGVNGGGNLGVGLLADTGGSDSYSDADGGKPDNFQVNKKGTVGVQVDLAATDPLPDTDPQPDPDLGSTTPTYSVDLCVEGVRNSCDGDTNAGQAENGDNDTVYGTIQAAVDAASTNQTLEVRPDTYHEAVSVTTPNLTLVANHSAAPGDVVLDGGAGTGDPLEDLSNGVNVQAAAVNLTGFIIRNYRSDEIELSAGANQALVRENTVHGSIGVTEANGTAIRANRIDQNNSGAAGLAVATAPYATVANNTVSGGGIILTDSATATVKNNMVRAISAEDNGGPVDGPGTAGTQATPAADSLHSVADVEPTGITVTGGHDVTVADNTVRSLSESGAQDGPVGIAVVSTTAPTVTNNSATDLTESGAGAGPIGIAVEDGSATNVTHNSVEIIQESGPGAGPTGIRVGASTLAVPIAHNEVTNTKAGGDGRQPAGLHIAHSNLDSHRAFSPNTLEDGGGVLIDNTTLAIAETTFAEDITVVNNSTIDPVTNNTFAGNVTIRNSTVSPIITNTITGEFQIHESTGLTIRNNNFTGYFQIQNSMEIAVIDNMLNGATLTLQSTEGATVKNNTLRGKSGTLELEGTNDSTIVGNVIEGLRSDELPGKSVGISVVDGRDTSVFHNVIENLDDGDAGHCSRSADGAIGIQITRATNTTLTGNTLRDFDEFTEGRGPIGIRVIKSTATTVSSNSITDIVEKTSRSGQCDPNSGRLAGFVVLDSAKTNISNNLLRNVKAVSGKRNSHQPASTGVNLTGTVESRVSGNTIPTVDTGIHLADTAQSRVMKNNFTGVTHGLVATSPTGVTVSKNSITIRADGGGKGPLGIGVMDGTGTSIAENTIVARSTDNRDSEIVGVMATDSSTTSIANNRLLGMATGIRLEATANSFVRKNNLTAVTNQSVVVDSNTPDAVRITHNTFNRTATFGVHNLNDAVINATHNYWGSPTGPSSPNPTSPLADPETGTVAKGTGATVSAGPAEVHADVHFDPWLVLPGGADSATGTSAVAVEGECDTVDRDRQPVAAENADGDIVYGTIQAAVDAASPGTEIQVGKCTYPANVTVNTSGITLTGFKGAVLAGENDRGRGVTVRADNVLVRGFEVYNYSTGIAVTGAASGTRIRHTVIRNAATGITVTGAGTRTSIRNATISSGSTGIVMLSSDATVVNTTLRNNDNGTVIYGDGAPRMEGNYFRTNGHSGLYLADNATVTDVTIYHNVFEGNDDYGVFNAHPSAVVNATNNHWGAFDAPSSPNGSGTTLTDPVTGQPANGTGDAVSAGSGGESNVHFDPYNVVHFRWDIDALVDDGADCEAANESIQAVVNDASEGDTVVVCAGTYLQNVTLNTDRLTLRGSRYAVKPTIKGFVETKARNYVLRGFTIKGRDGKKCVGRQHGSDSEVFDQHRPSCKGIIMAKGSRGMLIADNNLTGNRFGIRRPIGGDPGYNARVVNNNITGNQYGYQCIGGDKNCVWVDWKGEPLKFRNNRFINNSHYGIFTPAKSYAIRNIWECGGPSGGSRDPKTGRRANGSGDRISDNTRFDPFYEVGYTIIEGKKVPCSPSGPSLNPSPDENNNSDPRVQELSVSEVETSDPDAEFNVDWRVNDSDGNLREVELTLVDETTGGTNEQHVEKNVEGESADRVTRMVAATDDTKGHNYTVKLVVRDEAGNTSRATTTITETEPRETPTASWPSEETETPGDDSNDGGTGPGSGPGTGPGTGGSGGTNGTSTAGSGGVSTAEATAEGESQSTVQRTAESTDTRTSTASTPPPSTPPPSTPTLTQTPPVTPTPEVIPGFGVGAWVFGFVLLVGLIVARRRN